MNGSRDHHHAPTAETGQRWWAFPGPAALQNPSTVALIAANLAMIAVALWQQWEIGVLIWIYWFQSVIIGLFQFLKIITLRNFSTEGILLNGKPVQATTKTLWSMGLFFLLHYGLFHAVYLVFLVLEIPTGPVARDLIVPGALLFLINHAFSFIVNYWYDTGKPQNLGKVFVMPYARILPMHLAIIFSFAFLSGFGLVLFMLLKTVADVITHIAEHA
jgi:hypothetical protein